MGRGGSNKAQPEPSEQRNREGREGDGRCRLAVAKGGGHVPRDGTLTAPARGKPLLSILPNTAGRKRHPRGNRQGARAQGRNQGSGTPKPGTPQNKEALISAR